MAKKVRRRRYARGPVRATNWTLIGGILAIGIVGLFALLYVSLRNGDGLNSDSQSDSLLATYCNSNPDNCVANGSDDAPVTVVEVSDYGCGHCANFNKEKARALEEQYVASKQAKWVVMPYALRDQSGQFPTLPTAVSAMCANEQERFFDYHLAVFELQGSSLFNTEEGFMQTAASLDMDVDRFGSCLSDNDYASIIMRNISMAGNAGVRTTPTFFINGSMISGNLPRLADYQQLIDQQLGS